MTNGLSSLSAVFSCTNIQTYLWRACETGFIICIRCCSFFRRAVLAVVSVCSSQICMICSDVWHFVEFGIFAIYSYPLLHLRPLKHAFLLFSVGRWWRWGNQRFQKIIMRFQPFKLNNGFGSGIILAATTSAKGANCYGIMKHAPSD